ncbi:Farnesyl pyrophosphate synthase 2 [Orchesella cincta]|uniref:Farnesyl pyrophosphate synthase 2 n=1 Tax=Orchesella cincta TaxID=48709 RepID=A0A1D2M3N2_ORCCI|nr:Farnesyl pyrophosphate synthase 2 [Orchesella cincta]
MPVNDSWLLEQFVYQLIRKHFRKTNYYTDLIDLFLQVTQKTVLGQCLDTQTAVDDYLDCYGSEADIGKAGTDIQNGKCSWLFVRSQQLCSKEQLAMLFENYGKSDDDKKMQGMCLKSVQELRNDEMKGLMRKLLEMVTARI